MMPKLGMSLTWSCDEEHDRGGHLHDAVIGAPDMSELRERAHAILDHLLDLFSVGMNE